MEWKVIPMQGKPGWIVTVKDDCDLYGAPKFYEAMGKLLEEGVQHLHIDFSAVTYMDSTGVGAIIRIVQGGVKHKSEITFSGLQGTPRKVLKMSNILPLLHETDQGVK